MSLFLFYAPVGSPKAAEAAIGGPFTMTNQNGERVSDKDFLGRPMLLSFGYTYCPDVCPTQLLAITAALQQLGEAGRTVQAVFVTVDPERDTPEQLKAYLANFAPGYVGLTGTAADIAAMARTFRIYYAKVGNAKDPLSYTMDHTSFIYLMDEKGRFIKHFSAITTNSAEFAGELRQALAGLEK